MLSGVITRRLAVITAAIVACLAITDRASAGYGTYPDGQSFEVITSGGYIDSPRNLDLVVYLDGRDSSPWVWVSESPHVGPYGTPLAGTGVGSCSPSTLISHEEPGKWVCRVPTILMRPGRTYYWWLDFNRLEDGHTYPQPRISGPFAFALTERAAPPPPTPTVPPVDEYYEVEDTYSTATVDGASTLRSRQRYDGDTSIKHTRITQLVYRTMKALGLPRQLAFACWTEVDLISVVESEGGSTHGEGGATLTGFWLARQPRWLHLSPDTCTHVQALLDTKRVNGRRAFALTTVIHETLHAYGVRNEAQTNCFAVQLVPLFAAHMGMPARRANYAATLARNVTRRTAPPGYWNASHCRDRGPWDLFPARRNLG